MTGSLLKLLLLVGALLRTLRAEPFTNPLNKKDCSDPWIVYNRADGFYYLTTTTWKDLQITRARTLNGLKTGENRVVFRDGNPDRCCNLWAPELHELDGTWYIYYTAGQTKDLGLQRPHVVRG